MKANNTNEKVGQHGILKTTLRDKTVHHIGGAISQTPDFGGALSN